MDVVESEVVGVEWTLRRLMLLSSVVPSAFYGVTAIGNLGGYDLELGHGV